MSNEHAKVTEEHRKLAREIDMGDTLPKAWWDSRDEKESHELWVEWAAQLLADALRDRAVKEAEELRTVYMVRTNCSPFFLELLNERIAQLRRGEA